MLFSTLPLHAITREMHTDQGYGREQGGCMCECVYVFVDGYVNRGGCVCVCRHVHHQELLPLTFPLTKKHTHTHIHTVAISSDPGRFVCNYLYFHSLELCRDRGHAHTACVFVHLPPFRVVCEEKQLLFLKQLVQVVGKHFPSA